MFVSTFGAGMVENPLPAPGCCQSACRTIILFGYGRLLDLRIRFEYSFSVALMELSLNFECLARVYSSRFRHQMSNSFRLIGIDLQYCRNSWPPSPCLALVKAHLMSL